jgi:outer membrane protein assembly factor BamB
VTVRQRLLPVLLLTLPLAASAADWPQFRGPEGSGVSPEKGLPDKWDATTNVRWKVDLPGRGLSCPVVAGGRVYVTACSGYREGRLQVLCYDEKTGKKLWERQFASTGNTSCHPKTCMAAPTPVTDGQAVYALFATGDLAAISADGDLLWYRSLVGDYPNLTNQVGMAASPVLAGDVLLLPMENAGDSFRAGVDRRTGRNVWKQDQPRNINWVTPTVHGSGKDAMAVFHTAQEVTAYDITTGKVRWTLPGTGASETVSAASGEGLVFVSGREFRALRPSADGAAPEVVWKSTKLASSYASPVYYEGTLYVLTNTGLKAVNPKTGEEKWLKRLDGPFAASPVLADGKAFIVNEKGKAFVLALNNDRAPEVLSANDLSETFLATPSIANGAIYLRSDQHLWCIGKK